MLRAEAAVCPEEGADCGDGSRIRRALPSDGGPWGGRGAGRWWVPGPREAPLLEVRRCAVVRLHELLRWGVQDGLDRHSLLGWNCTVHDWWLRRSVIRTAQPLQHT